MNSSTSNTIHTYLTISDIAWEDQLSKQEDILLEKGEHLEEFMAVLKPVN